MYPLVSLSPALQIPTYFLVISIACCVGMIWFWRRAIAADLNGHLALDISLVVFGAGFVGARLLHVLWEDPQFYWDNPSLIFNIFAGGYVFLGGMISAIIATYFFCRMKNESFWQWADLLAPVAALTYALGRVGCLLRGCCYGKICELPWSITIEGALRHPTQAYATLAELCIVVYLLWQEKRPHKTGTLFLSWLIIHGCARVILELFRDDPRGFAPLGASLATWLSIALIAGALRYRSQIQK